jgi:hypothetical protein
MKTYLIYILTATCLFFTPILGLLVTVGAVGYLSKNLFTASKKEE